MRTGHLTRAGLAFLIFLAIAGAPAHAQPPTPEAARAWGFDRSDLTPHPGVRFGLLPNGMRYALMRNATPAGSLSVRLRFDVGSAAEGAREQGLVHLLEHMIFHGTPNIPEGALPLMLSTRGLRRWTDFNAYTSYDETVFRLDLAQSDSGARETALALMHEIAANLAFSARAVSGAKAKVREEIRARDAVQDRIAAAQNAFFMPGTPIARGTVAGSVRDIGRATPAALRRLYDLYYRPERATLVLVGDFDPDAVEAEIAARFSEWRERAPAAAAPARLPIRTAAATKARLFVDPAAPTTVTIARVTPLAAPGDAGGRRDAHFLEHLGAEMLNRRLQRLAGQADPPFASGNVAIYDHFSTARLARVELAARDRDWRRALHACALELRRAVEQGFTQAELDEQLAISSRGLARPQPPRTSSALADAIVDAAARGIVFTEPGDASAMAAYLARIRLADVNAAFSSAWEDSGRLIFVSHNRRIPEAEAAIAAAWTGSMR